MRMHEVESALEKKAAQTPRVTGTDSSFDQPLHQDVNGYVCRLQHLSERPLGRASDCDQVTPSLQGRRKVRHVSLGASNLKGVDDHEHTSGGPIKRDCNAWS